MYTNDELEEDVTDVDRKEETANCPVISRLESEIRSYRVILLQKTRLLVSSIAMSPSVLFAVLGLNFANGFECKVVYDSPETGEEQEVIKNSRCAENLYPETRKCIAFIHNTPQVIEL